MAQITAKFTPPVLEDADSVVVRVLYNEGEYLSGYMPNCAYKSLEALELSHYVSGWGNILDADDVKALGKEFTIAKAKELAIPRLKAKFDKKNAAKAIKDAKRSAAFDEAKRTGKEVVLHQWSEDCDGSEEECDVDNLTEVARPDGTTKVYRSHSW